MYLSPENLCGKAIEVKKKVVGAGEVCVCVQNTSFNHRGYSTMDHVAISRFSLAP